MQFAFRDQGARPWFPERPRPFNAGGELVVDAAVQREVLLAW
jgi:hypothetical protein